MNIKEMHYLFKQRFNKIDSSQNREFKVPEIDSLLNQAQTLIIRNTHQPKNGSSSIDYNFRNSDDFRSVIVWGYNIQPNNDGVSFTLPLDYQYYLGSTMTTTKNGTFNECICNVRRAFEYEKSYFYKSSHEWLEVGIAINNKGIEVTDKEDFNVVSLSLDYVKIPLQMNNSEESEGTVTVSGVTERGYYNFNGDPLYQNVNCSLPVTIHDAIVDLSVLLAKGAINTPTLNYDILKQQIN
jgi:hypothetical protein